MQNATSIQISSGNVFEDLGLQPSDEMLKKAELAHQITDCLSPSQSCELLNLPIDQLANLMKGNLNGFTLAQLSEAAKKLQN